MELCIRAYIDKRCTLFHEFFSSSEVNGAGEFLPILLEPIQYYFLVSFHTVVCKERSKLQGSQLM